MSEGAGQAGGGGDKGTKHKIFKTLVLRWNMRHTVDTDGVHLTIFGKLY